jgi:hypothetical protein
MRQLKCSCSPGSSQRMPVAAPSVLLAKFGIGFIVKLS